jgi:hypothetical protein
MTFESIFRKNLEKDFGLKLSIYDIDQFERVINEYIITGRKTFLN